MRSGVGVRARLRVDELGLGLGQRVGVGDGVRVGVGLVGGQPVLHLRHRLARKRGLVDHGAAAQQQAVARHDELHGRAGVTA